jgi:hypothetical protein
MEFATEGFVYNHEDERFWFKLYEIMQEGDVEADDDDDNYSGEIEHLPDANPGDDSTRSEDEILRDDREDETALSREYF